MLDKQTKVDEKAAEENWRQWVKEILQNEAVEAHSFIKRHEAVEQKNQKTLAVSLSKDSSWAVATLFDFIVL